MRAAQHDRADLIDRVVSLEWQLRQLDQRIRHAAITMAIDGLRNLLPAHSAEMSYGWDLTAPGHAAAGAHH